MNTIVFGAVNGEITIHNDNGGYAKVDCAGLVDDHAGMLIAEAIRHTGGSSNDNFYNSSSIDYCDEEGFEDDEALRFVDAGLSLLFQMDRKSR